MSDIVIFIILGIIAIPAVGSFVLIWKSQKRRHVASGNSSVAGDDTSLAAAELKVEMHEQMQIREDATKAAVQEHIEALLSPFRLQLSALKDKLDSQYSSGSDKMTKLDALIKNLAGQHQRLAETTINLSNALKGSTRTQGEFGELQLESLLQSSGLQEGVGYDRQSVLSDASGKSVPDIIINLPDNGYIVVDAKASMPAYFRLLEASNKKDKEIASKALRSSMKSHVKSLAAKNYDSKVGRGSPNMVFMFTPMEGALQEVIKYDNEFLHWASKQRIFVLTPLSLIPVLNIVAQLWRHSQQEESVYLVIDQVAKMLDALSEFLVYFENIGKSLKKAGADYDTARLTLTDSDKSILRQVHSIKDLGVSNAKPLPKSLPSQSTFNQ